MQIKEIEKLTGMKDVNIRYYEKQGLLHPERKPNGYREYSEADVDVIKRIKILRLLEIPISDVKQILEGSLDLKSAITNRLHQLDNEETKIQDIRLTCEKILANNIRLETLSEELLCGSNATWKERLTQMMKKDINKNFLWKATIFMAGWAMIFKLLLLCWNYARLNVSFPEVLTYEPHGIKWYLLTGAGIFFILYGIGLSIFEAVTDKGFLWIWARNWGASGLGGLANSFTYCGLGVALIGTNTTKFVLALIFMEFLVLTIRGGWMYRQSAAGKANIKSSVIVLCSVVFLLLIFIISVLYLYIDYTAKY